MKWLGIKNNPALVAISVGAFITLVVYLFVPLGPITFAPQEAFRADADIRMALMKVAESWGVQEENLYIFATRVTGYGDKSVAIIDPETLSSAKVWIASPQRQPGQRTSGLNLPERIHLLNQYVPQSPLERAIAHNFYTKGGWARSQKAVIENIEARFPFGQVRSSSLRIGELQMPTIFTYPIFFLSVHFDLF